jgi:hypothetical protein
MLEDLRDWSEAVRGRSVSVGRVSTATPLEASHPCGACWALRSLQATRSKGARVRTH